MFLYSTAHINTAFLSVLMVVGGGDKSAALNNLPAWRRSTVRDLTALRRQWKGLLFVKRILLRTGFLQVRDT